MVAGLGAVVAVIWFIANSLFFATSPGAETASGNGSDAPSLTSDSPSGQDEKANPAESSNGLTMEHRMPNPSEVESDATVVEVYEGDASVVAETTKSMTIRLGASRTGGLIAIIGESGVGPSGEFHPDGQGGFVWEDRAIHGTNPNTGQNSSDSDEVSDAAIEGDVLSFRLRRTNVDGSLWDALIAVSTASGTWEWFQALPAPNDIGCSTTMDAVLNASILKVTGDVSFEPGTVVEVWISGQNGTDRQLVEVGPDGSISVEVEDYVPWESGEDSFVNVTVVKGSHFCGAASADL